MLLFRVLLAVLKIQLPTIICPRHRLRFPTASIYNASVICLFQVFTTALLEDMIFLLLDQRSGSNRLIIWVIQLLILKISKHICSPDIMDC